MAPLPTLFPESVLERCPVFYRFLQAIPMKDFAELREKKVSSSCLHQSSAYLTIEGYKPTSLVAINDEN